MTDLEQTATCPRHPKVETALRCASCGEPICPKCLVQTPVGAKCPKCGTQSGNKLFRPTLLQSAATVAAGLALGAFAGWAVEFIGGYFALILATAYGWFAGSLILWASGRKRGWRMELIAGLAMALGVVGGRILVVLPLLAAGQVHPPYGVWTVIVDLVMPTPFPLIGVVLVVSGAIGRIRYL